MQPETVIMLCALCFVSAGKWHMFPFPPGLFHRLRSIEDYPRVARLPPVRRRFEAFLDEWRSRHEECGRQAIKPYMPLFRVVGGLDARPGSWPWMISLKQNKIGQIWCGATLIARQWAVTAAHCFKGPFSDPETWTVQLGRYNTTPEAEEMTGVERRIGRLYKHPGYKGGFDFTDDIALIKLDQPVDFSDVISPLCLPDASVDADVEIKSGTECVVTGWGVLGTEGPLGSDVPHVLQQGLVPLISERDCRNFPGFARAITRGMMCAGYTEGGVDTCFGDSGGPLQCQVGHNWYLAGVTSHGINDTCADPEKPGIYTNILRYTDWIYWHMFLDPFF
ncbi:chymotrypsinogen 2-like [Haliotis asinina]|uniref:chymotrypsinogen 2-like n=1 Tax=Haliotis asinina TaxID=109174 RepID=UPI003531C98D